MASVDTDPPLVVIIGPTASGKTSLAIEVALQFGGEVICADSRTVYKDMDIGTAKPTKTEQRGIPHWGLDVASPEKRYSAAQFQSYAQEKIDDIRCRGRLPIMVGGTGLYVDSVLFSYEYPIPPTDKQTAMIESMNNESLVVYCNKHNIELPMNDKNRRHLVRAVLSKNGNIGSKRGIEANTVVVGITTNKEVLKQRIEQRTEQMFEHGVVVEATMLGEKYGWDSEAMTSNVYRSLKKYLDTELSLEEAKDTFKTRDWQLAKQQMTWFRRNPHIEWCVASEAFGYISARLATE